jgi:peptide/nickel transport system permease protein
MRSSWLRFALRRAVVLVVSLWALTTATFLVTHLVPGDPARAGLAPSAPIAQVKARRATLHLDKPLLSQYATYTTGALRGDFGTSFTSGQPVKDIISQRFPPTARLAISAFVAMLLIGVPLGMLTAIATRTGGHRVAGSLFAGTTGAFISVPDYLLATGLVALFGVTLSWLPVAGDATIGAYVLPVAALAALPTASLARTARVETLKVLDQEYMRVARSKRLPSRHLYLRHALPNALTATLTMCGVLFGGLVAGTVIVENVFAWPGLGSAVTGAITQKDYPLVQGIVLLLGGIALVANTVVDVVLALVDPRSTIEDA